MTDIMRGAGRCPRCASRAVVRMDDVPDTKFYARTIEACRNCHALWEPFDPAESAE